MNQHTIHFMASHGYKYKDGKFIKPKKGFDFMDMFNADKERN